MWINAAQAAQILNCCVASAYKLLNQMRAELREKKYYLTPTVQVPIPFFCEKLGLDKNEVKEALRNI